MPQVPPAAPEVVLFDLDGTLVDTYRLYLESYRRALEPVLGRRPTDEEILRRGPSSERGFLTAWVGAERADDCHAAMCSHYAELHRTLCEGLYDGVREMLAALRSAGIPIGIVTSKGRRAWEVTRRELDLGELDVVVTEDDVEEPKPHPGPLFRALRALGADPPDAAYVGDSTVDLAAGRAAGVRVGAALWPKTTPGDRERFLSAAARHRPDWLFERPADVSRTFAPWC